MKLIPKTDPLFLFLAVSLVLTLLLSRDDVLTGNRLDWGTDLRISVDHELNCPPPGFISDQATIGLFNGEHELWYSVDGGDAFRLADQGTLLHTIENEPVIYRSTSLRWRHPAGEFPRLISLPVLVKRKNENRCSEQKVFTWYDSSAAVLPIVSLSVKNSDLFDEVRGLMVYGMESWSDSLFYREWWYRPANFSARGMEWERPVNFQYFENGRLIHEQDCGLRISGNATRYFPQKSFRIYARKKSGQDRIDYPFWEEEGNASATSLLLRNGGNDNTRTMFADLLMQNLARKCHVLTLAGKPVSVFINGNYWGIYDLRERIDPYYVAGRENAKEEDITILDAPNGTLKDGEEEEQEAYVRLVEELTDVNSVSDKQYAECCEQVDISSFIDYIVFETFYNNSDWPHNNCTWYKVKDQKWKWIIYDTDASLAYNGPESVSHNSFEDLLSGSDLTSRLFAALIRNDTFKAEFKKRAFEILETSLSEASIRGAYTILYSQYKKSIQLQINRWRQIRNSDQWEQDCDSNLRFLIDRRSVYRNHLNDL